MKRTTNDLLEEYRQADFTKRLHLYLQHRDLRPEFVETDQSELAPKATRSTDRSRRVPKFFTCCFEKA
jgi:hypothetical protein